MTDDSALARELADRLIGLHRSQQGPRAFHPDAALWQLIELLPTLAALLRKWPEPDKDAERYRWLRDTGDATWVPLSRRINDPPQTVAQMEAHIDAAMTASPKEER